MRNDFKKSLFAFMACVAFATQSKPIAFAEGARYRVELIDASSKMLHVRVITKNKEIRYAKIRLIAPEDPILTAELETLISPNSDVKFELVPSYVNRAYRDKTEFENVQIEIEDIAWGRTVLELEEESRLKAAIKEADEEIEKQIRAQPKAIQKLIRAHKIKMGMTGTQVVLSMGLPESRNRTVGPWGVKEQWVYGLGDYVYLTNNKVTSWQERR